LSSKEQEDLSADWQNVTIITAKPYKVKALIHRISFPSSKQSASAA
jgi:hypothetical protein